MTRPKVLEGKTAKLKVGCGSLFLTLNLKDGQPFEIFLSGSKLGGCKSNQEGLGRLITLLFRKGATIDEIKDTLELIKCPACSAAKAKLEPEEKKDFPTSCPDAVAKFLDLISK